MENKKYLQSRLQNRLGRGINYSMTHQLANMGPVLMCCQVKHGSGWRHFRSNPYPVASEVMDYGEQKPAGSSGSSSEEYMVHSDQSTWLVKDYLRAKLKTRSVCMVSKVSNWTFHVLNWTAMVQGRGMRHVDNNVTSLGPNLEYIKRPMASVKSVQVQQVSTSSFWKWTSSLSSPPSFWPPTPAPLP